MQELATTGVGGLAYRAPFRQGADRERIEVVEEGLDGNVSGG